MRKKSLAVLGALSFLTLNAQSFIHYTPFGGTEVAAEVVSVPGDGIYWVGHTNAFGTQDILVIKYDFQGNFIWSYVYDSNQNEDDRAYGAAPVTGGGIVIAGEIRGGVRDGLALYVQPNGNVGFARQFTGIRANFNDVIQHSNGSFYFVGKERMGGGREEVVLVILDINGNTIAKFYYDDGQRQLG